MRLSRSSLRLSVALLVLFCLSTPKIEAKKKKTAKASGPDMQKLGNPVVGPNFGQELANVSRAATKLRHWHEYETVSKTIVKVLMREAEKGTRILHATLVNPDRQFGQTPDPSRYKEVLNFMMKGKNGIPNTEEQDDPQLGVLDGACLPLREKFCVDKIARATRLGSYITVENCHRWNAASMLLAGTSEEVNDFPDISIDWRKVCDECFSERVQVALTAFHDHGKECVELSDEDAETIAPQIPSNWTIDVSTRTTIGGMRMEERKLLPIGGRWAPLPAIHTIVLQELLEGGVDIRVLNEDGSTESLERDSLKDSYSGVMFNYAIYLW